MIRAVITQERLYCGASMLVHSLC